LATGPPRRFSDPQNPGSISISSRILVGLSATGSQAGTALSAAPQRGRLTPDEPGLGSALPRSSRLLVLPSGAVVICPKKDRNREEPPVPAANLGVKVIDEAALEELLRS